MKQNQYQRDKILFAILIIFIALSSNSVAQKLPKKVNVRQVVVPYTDSSITTNVYIIDKKKRMCSKKKYYWYHHNEIRMNRGTYMKNPLHNAYYVFNKNNNLVEKGQFRFGKRVGVWRKWYDSGELRSVEHYYIGYRKGKSLYYSQDGRLNAKLMYKKDLLHGKQFYYYNDSLAVFKYKRGVNYTILKEGIEKKDKKAKEDSKITKDNNKANSQAESKIEKADKKKELKNAKQKKERKKTTPPILDQNDDIKKTEPQNINELPKRRPQIEKKDNEFKINESQTIIENGNESKNKTKNKNFNNLKKKKETKKIEIDE